MGIKEAARTLLVGMAMGAAEVVPGVSGGTIAFISGIYERLLRDINQFTPYLIVRLRREGFVALWHALDINFLLLLFGGMGISILLFASGISYLLVHEPTMLWSFFFGLVLASAWVVSRQIEDFSRTALLGILCGAVFGYVITQVVPVSIEATPITLFLGGAVAVCAWILPGLSGSFILLILGLYTFVLAAIKSMDIYSLAFLGAGCAVGLLLFAQLLTMLFGRARELTLAVLTGFMIGSVAKLWPWKYTTSFQLKPDGTQVPVVQELVTPVAFAQLTGQEPQVGIAIGACLFGLVVVAGFHWLATRSSDASSA